MLDIVKAIKEFPCMKIESTECITRGDLTYELDCEYDNTELTISCSSERNGIMYLSKACEQLIKYRDMDEIVRQMVNKLIDSIEEKIENTEFEDRVKNIISKYITELTIHVE